MKKWQNVKLGELLSESKVESKNPDTKKRIRVKLNVGGIEQRPDTNDKEGATKYYIRNQGQFIYGRQNMHKGAFGIIPEELDGFESSSDIPSFDVNKACYPEWIFYFFKQGNFYLKLESLAKGVGSKRIHQSQLFELMISLPPKDEQKKILESIRLFEKKYDELEKEINLQNKLIEKLKVTTLREAVNGKLTEQWRVKNSKQKHVYSLLDQIKIKKNELIANKEIQKLKPLPLIKHNEIPYPLPENWEWSRLGEIIKNIEAGRSPQCESRPAELDEWGVLKTTAIQNLEFLENENKALPKRISPNLRTEVKLGDVLITRAGPRNRVGIVCAVGQVRAKLLLSDKTVRLNTFNEFIKSEFLAIVLSSGASSDFLNSKKSGMAESQVNISQYDMTLTPVPLVPFHEQLEIINKVYNVMNTCKGLESNIAKHREKLKTLTISVLGEVFGTGSNDIHMVHLLEKTGRKNTKNKPSLTFSVEQLNLKKNDLNMELIELLKEHGKMSAITLWKMSKYENDIDAFYGELKKQVEDKKTIKENTEKGYLELIK